jgi:hypothetical protein
MLAGAAIFGVVNLSNFLRPVTCWDCFFPYGIPFTFFREGGFAGGGGIVWIGATGDAAIVLSFGTRFRLGMGAVFQETVKLRHYRPSLRIATNPTHLR